MPIPPEVVKSLKYIDANRENFIKELREIVRIPSISSNLRAHKQIQVMIRWLESRLKKLGFKVFLKDLGEYGLTVERKKTKIPYLVLGTFNENKNKRTLLYYCHLDILEVDEKNWQTNPFDLINKDEKLYGRGAAKMKGPLLSFLHAIDCYKELGIELPINIKLFCESMNTCNSEGIPEILKSLRTSFLADIDCILINEGNWLGRDYSCIINSFRGVCYFDVTINGPCKELNSGEYGGMLYEPMEDLIFLLSNLVDSSGYILVPHFYDNIMPITPEEEYICEKLKIDFGEFKKYASIRKFTRDGKTMWTLMHIWRHPCFNLHFIDTSNKCDSKIQLIIPKRIHARFSIRIVPHQTHEEVTGKILEYIKKILQSRCTPNDVKVKVHDSVDPWYENYSHWNYEAARVAVKQVFKEEANLIRDGRELPILQKIRKVLSNKNILVLPFANPDANIYSENENISINNYIENTKLLVAYFYQLKNVEK